MTTQYRIVPVEPTEEMLSDGHSAIDEGHKTSSLGECPGINWGDADACYKAMLSASPPLDADAVRELVSDEAITAACISIDIANGGDGTKAHMWVNRNYVRAAIEAALTTLLAPDGRAGEGERK